jgi:hypothetical protein
MSNNEIISFFINDGDIETLWHEERVWMAQRPIAAMFTLNVRTVNEHVQNFKKSHPDWAERTIRKFRIVAPDGKQREVEHYSLEVITYIGYRAQETDRTLAFQTWVNTVLQAHINVEREYLKRENAKLREHDWNDELTMRRLETENKDLRREIGKRDETIFDLRTENDNLRRKRKYLD